MDKIINFIKLALASMGALLSAKLGILYPVLMALLLAMTIDYISGMMAGGRNGELNSKKGIQGIFKKVAYMLAIACAMIFDWLLINVAAQIGLGIPTTTFFGLLVAIWFILNEILSIIENLGRFGVPLPNFLQKAVETIKGKVEEIGEKSHE